MNEPDYHNQILDTNGSHFIAHKGGNSIVLMKGNGIQCLFVSEPLFDCKLSSLFYLPIAAY